MWRAAVPEAFREELGLRPLPVEQGVLLEHGLELLAFRFAPAAPRAGRLLDGLLAPVQGQGRALAGGGLRVRPLHGAGHQDRRGAGNELTS